MTVVRRDLKNSLFIKIFGAPEHKVYLLSLFNALNDTSYAEGTEVEINTIEDVIYMGIKNDVSCIVDNKMSLMEHQSSVNPNMPVRGLMYFGRLYEKYIAQNDFNIYGSKLIKLPTPSYFVLYNGRAVLPDSSELRLSSAFIHEAASQKFEWTATVMNINIGTNEKLLKSCKVLEEYATFFEEMRIKIAAKGMDKERAISEVIDDCIRRGFILSEYLKRHKSEVAGMLLTEYNEEETMARFKRDYEADLAQANARAADAEAKAANAEAKAADAEAKAANAEAEAKAKTKLETAKKMKSKGFSLEVIMDCTELTAEQIAAI